MPLFNIVHIVIILSIPLCAYLFAKWTEKSSTKNRLIAKTLGAIIGGNELIWYSYVINKSWVSFPYGLPLDLCDIVLWLTVYTLLTFKQWSFNLIYYWGIAGTSMAVITPDFASSFPSYISIKFLFAHGCVVMAILFLVWSKSIRPDTGSWWKSLLWLNLYASIIGIYNFIFKTNYFYLCYKPASATLLDYLGPWPLYIFIGELIAIGLFYLLYLPFRKIRY